MAGGMGIPAPKAANVPFSMLEGLLRQQGVETAKKVLIYNPDAVGQWRVSEVYGVVCTRAASYAAGRTGLHRLAIGDAGLFWNDVYGGRAECTWNPEVREACTAAGDPCPISLAAEGKKTWRPAGGGEFQHGYPVPGSRKIRFMISFLTMGEVTDQAEELIRNSDYDVIVVYNQEYDDVMHRTFPESEQSLAALKHHIAAFDRLATDCRRMLEGSGYPFCVGRQITGFIRMNRAMALMARIWKRI